MNQWENIHHPFISICLREIPGNCWLYYPIYDYRFQLWHLARGRKIVVKAPDQGSMFLPIVLESFVSSIPSLREMYQQW